MDNKDIDKILKGYRVEPLSSAERVRFNQRLDSRIDRYQRRALSLYGKAYGRGSAVIARMSVGLGAAMIAVFAISIITLWTGIGQLNRNTSDGMSELDVMYYEYGLSDYDYTESDTLSEGYVDLLITNYVEDYGTVSTDALLGELSEEELIYLEENLDKGDIL